MAFTTVTGSNGVTSLVGTSGVDVATVVTLTSKVLISGQGANDDINVDLFGAAPTVSAYTVNGGAGDDFIDFSDNAQGLIINGDGGTGVAGSDQITFIATVLNSVINGDGGASTGVSGNDTIQFIGPDSIVINSAVNGNSGNDLITAAGLGISNSTVNGNAGNDVLTIGPSSGSFIYGGQDTDTITVNGNSSGTLVNGNKGSDTITVGLGFAFGAGSVYGGNGNDVIIAQNVTAANGADLAATAAGVFLSGDLGDDTITGSTGIDTINGGDGNDSITAGTGADVIDGGAGNDIINGGAGIDNIIGGTGNDTISGGAAGDTIQGGAGNNVFVYTNLADSALGTDTSNTGFDTITGFISNTAAAGASANGDRFAVTRTAVGVVPSVQIATGTFNSTTFASQETLAGTLNTALDGVVGVPGSITLAANGVSLVSITGASSFAGNYVVIDGNNAPGYDSAFDAVIKVNTLANITANTFIAG